MMLGLTSYQEALRAVGRIVREPGDVRIVEHAAEGWLEVITPARTLHFDAAQLEEIVLGSVAKRGEHRPAGEASDLLRTVGLALDEVHALDVCIALSSRELNVRYSDQSGHPRELNYAADELDSLRRSAAARRNGQPLRRILILQAGPETASRLSELLVAEFAVQSLPMPYARAIAASSEPPDLVVAQLCDGTAEAVNVLRSGTKTAQVPVLVLGSGGPEMFVLGADDVLQEPVQPAQLRARIRTLLLRGR
jgi:CheY-like chemotaxis protein